MVTAIAARTQAITPSGRARPAQNAGFTAPAHLETIRKDGGNGRYCYPLTVTDQASRFLLLCEALESTRAFQR